MLINPSDLSKKDAYQLMIGCIVPRAIALVSTVSEKGIFNIAPFSYFTGISSKPPLVCFSPARKRDGEKKDTWKNVEYTNDFVINVVTEENTQRMNISATEFPEDISEFEQSGFTAIPSQIVKSPRIKESPIQMECKLVKIVEFEQTTTGLIIGEIILYHIEDDLLLQNYKIDIHKLKPVGRLGGNEYCRVNDIFEMERHKFEPKK
jgi:flavin reductase (DIM6/NTAB) family NADH-FMN oxidoreductase RutF